MITFDCVGTNRLLVYGKFMAEKSSNPTMQRIADAAGVSRMTVSLALRNHPRISAATRERIRQVAERLGYHPDPEVSKLMAYLRRAKPAKHARVLGLFT